MSEYIKREDAIKAIKRDVMGGLNYESILNRLPSADVVEVVRCKDCKYAMTEDCPMDELYADNYCNYGVRKG